MPPPMNVFNRVLQWGALSRQWWLYDAYGQDVFRSSIHVRPYLQGKNKPHYHALSDNGDHVVIVNSKFCTMEADLWERVEFYKKTNYPKGDMWTPAWKAHQEDPTEVMRKSIRRKIKGNHLREVYMARLHVFPDLSVPEDIMRNISAQIKQIQYVPKKLHEFSEEERARFPRLFEFPADFMIEEALPILENGDVAPSLAAIPPKPVLTAKEKAKARR